MDSRGSKALAQSGPGQRPGVEVAQSGGQVLESLLMNPSWGGDGSGFLFVVVVLFITQHF